MERLHRLLASATGRRFATVLAGVLLESGKCRVTLPGGELYRKQNIIVSAFEDDLIQRYHGSRMFMGTPGIGVHGVMESDPLLIQAEQKLLRQAEQLVVLADSSKIGARGLRIRHRGLRRRRGTSGLDRRGEHLSARAPRVAELRTMRGAIRDARSRRAAALSASLRARADRAWRSSPTASRARPSPARKRRRGRSRASRSPTGRSCRP